MGQHIHLTSQKKNMACVRNILFVTVSKGLSTMIYSPKEKYLEFANLNFAKIIVVLCQSQSSVVRICEENDRNHDTPANLSCQISGI